MTQQTLKGFVVLVVDDDADSLHLAMTVVESFGCGVLSASGCDDALAILDSGAHVDLVFSDVIMPKTSGVTLARLVRERHPTLPSSWRPATRTQSTPLRKVVPSR